ncbi:hypothetical protein RHIZ404_220496 [Rhizobium sp. EC-SD404]|nr:hypothetical protein RHIZ404_220496 [Rhizobium sp. EC-SD404]
MRGALRTTRPRTPEKPLEWRLRRTMAGRLLSTNRPPAQRRKLREGEGQAVASGIAPDAAAMSQETCPSISNLEGRGVPLLANSLVSGKPGYWGRLRGQANTPFRGHFGPI